MQLYADGFSALLKWICIQTLSLNKNEAVLQWLQEYVERQKCTKNSTGYNFCQTILRIRVREEKNIQLAQLKMSTPIKGKSCFIFMKYYK